MKILFWREPLAQHNVDSRPNVSITCARAFEALSAELRISLGVL